MDEKSYEINILRKQITHLSNKNKMLSDENNLLKEQIKNLQDQFGYEICLYFNRCKSISRTAENFYFESVKHCYDKLCELYGSSTPLSNAVDFSQHYEEIHGKDIKL